MENSILQKLEQLAKKIWERAETGELSDVDIMATHVLEDCKTISADIIEMIITEMNEGLRSDKSFRREQGLVLKEKDRRRSVLTTLGPIEYKRDYYYDKNTGRHCSVLDRMLGIEKYERIGGAVGAELVNQAAMCSYAKAAAIVTGGAVSRQSVRLQILKANIPEKEPREENRAVKELHVYADEDHVHMQKPGKERGKRNRIVPLITVTEGTDRIAERRNRTRNPMYFSDRELNPKAAWESVEGYIEKAYDIDQLEAIYVHGDGGSWIEKGLDNFAKTRHVMDGYHFYKELRGVSQILPKRNVRTALIFALKHNDRKRADDYMQELLASPLNDKERERLERFAVYLFRSWDTIRRRVTEDIPGSCTEAQISHVLSERLSRDPIGWGIEALGQIVETRVYLFNGGRLEKKDMRRVKEDPETYRKYAERCIEEYLKSARDFSLFEKEEPIMDTGSATRIMIHKMGRTMSLLS